MAYVFQYGSNTLSSRLNSEDRLKGDARSLGVVYTREDFELDFNVFSDNNQCAAADIIPNGSRKIWGVLYEIPDYLIRRGASPGRKSLDAIEGEGNNYRRIGIALRYPDGSPVEEDAITYVVINRQSDCRTSLDYCRFIVAGLREHNISDEYIDYVKGRMVTNNETLRDAVEFL